MEIMMNACLQYQIKQENLEIETSAVTNFQKNLDGQLSELGYWLMYGTY